MSNDDVEYYRRRAEEERARAACATRVEVRSVHLTLAKEYEALAADPALRWDSFGAPLRHPQRV